jgi:hypothetical protein
VQGAIITSQLKFPYYAAQAKRLLVDAKIKLLSAKSFIMSATSTLLSSQPLPPGSLHAGSSSAIATSAQAAIQTLNTGSQLPNGGAHAAMAVQWLDVAAGLLESAITALSSDAVQKAEDMAKLAEQASQSAMAHISMAAASASSVLDMATQSSIQFFQSVDTATASALADHALVCAHHVEVAGLQILLACGARSP